MAEANFDIPKGQRARLTCNECHRRKVRCDKGEPCGTCVKRGLAEVCRRELHFKTASAGPTQQGNIPNAASDTIQLLLNRVSELESALKDKEPGHAKTTLNPQSNAQNVDDAALPVDEDSSGADSQDDDAPIVMEFMAWGRSKNSAFHKAPENESGPRWHNVNPDDTSQVSDFLMDNVRSAQLDMLEALLPSIQQIYQLSNYHSHSLLWYHGSYFPTTFERDLDTFISDFKSSVRVEGLNLQWLALLFAILTGSMTSASSSTCRSWGFTAAERSKLSQAWYNAAVTCLHMGNFLERHRIYSVQAVATLTVSAHILGFSNSQSTLLASAGRIAQSLGLHRLGSETRTGSIEGLRKREAGRRVWAQLCTQDWFSVPFSESYALRDQFFDTAKPINCNEDMVIQPQSIPTQVSYCNYLYDIAALMPKLQDALSESNTLYTKYENVLQYDDKMRKLATAYMPTFLSSGPVSEHWPNYVAWARRSLAICAGICSTPLRSLARALMDPSAHKIIMIHRKFLALSFTNSAFSFTRRTCIAASKTILKETQAPVDDSAPVLWIDQAFAVAAGIILSLDAFHRKPTEPELEEHKAIVFNAIEWLKGFEINKLAIRGVKLLTYLLYELDKPTATSPRKRGAEESPNEDRSGKRARRFSLSSFMRGMSSEAQVPTPNTDQVTPAGDPAWDAFIDLMPPQTGFGADDFFEDFFSF